MKFIRPGTPLPENVGPVPEHFTLNINQEELMQFLLRRHAGVDEVEGLTEEEKDAAARVVCAVETNDVSANLDSMASHMAITRLPGETDEELGRRLDAALGIA